jgi:SAM-dependent methyltransferase
MSRGARDLYRDPLYYDSIFDVRTADLGFYTPRYRAAEGWILELAVGTGRVALPAVEAGAKVLGVDLSRAMLRQARRRSQRLHLIQADMRRLAFHGQFALISAPFNALMHLYSDADLDACLSGIAAHLAPDGRFVFDIFQLDLGYLQKDPDRWVDGEPYDHPTHGGRYAYAEHSHFDVATRLHTLRFRSQRLSGEGPALIEGVLTQRYFAPGELARRLARHGLVIEAEYGDFQGGPLLPGSESHIAVARRA